ncbi:MAG: hypothetical protein DWQ01_21650 [Planctomycetota bacterium]|nr:MAG: hypothetical protein DWQ01_21650 [Planctomycetota bacterium]
MPPASPRADLLALYCSTLEASRIESLNQERAAGGGWFFGDSLAEGLQHPAVQPWRRPDQDALCLLLSVKTDPPLGLLADEGGIRGSLLAPEGRLQPSWTWGEAIALQFRLVNDELEIQDQERSARLPGISPETGLLFGEWVALAAMELPFRVSRRKS